MANQFFTDFSEYTTDQFPNDWTYFWNPDEGAQIAVREVAGTTGGKVLRFSDATGTSNRHRVTWNIVDSLAGRGNAEIVARIRLNVATTSIISTLLRGGGTSASRNGYTTQSLVSPSRKRIVEFDDETATFSSEFSGDTWEADQWFIIAQKANGGDHFVKYWKDSETEPGYLQVTGLDGSIHTDGRIGIGGIAHEILEIDWVGIGIDGQDAPREPLDQFEITSPEEGATNVPVLTPFSIANPDGHSHVNLRVHSDLNDEPNEIERDIILGDIQNEDPIEHTLATPLNDSDLYFAMVRREV